MDKLTTNYHTHTYRCGHAVGKDEDYVLSAIKEGIKILGFSDHISYPNLPQKGIRQDYEMLPHYLSSINQLKDKYKKEIEIHVGFEAEYFPQLDSYYHDLLDNKGLEYLILGQHCYLNENNEYIFYNSTHNDYQNLKRYVDEVIMAMNTGLFVYVAHPDIILNSFDEIDEKVLDEMKRIIFESIKLNIPLEINVAGIRYQEKGNENLIGFKSKRYYPYDEFFSLVGKYHAPVVIGVDAHDPKDFQNEEAIKKAFMLVDKYNLNLVDTIKLNNKK